MAQFPAHDLPDADLPNIDLPDADLPDGDLPDADLRNSDLPDGDLPDADLPDADLRNAELPDADLLEADLRVALVSASKRLDTLGLNRGSTGNLSHRLRNGMLITPTGMGADELRPQDLVWLGHDGTLLGDWQPSSEWHFHRATYLARPDLNAVVHTHSANATALACLDRGLPAFHYMVAIAGGDDIACTPYHTFGTEQLSAAVALALTDRQACLMAHHGMVAAGAALAQAMKIAIEVESLCEVYLKALAVAEPALLSKAAMAEVIERFRGYGKTARR